MKKGYWSAMNGKRFSTLQEGVNYFVKHGWRVVERGNDAVKLGLWELHDTIDDPIVHLDHDLPNKFTVVEPYYA